MLRGAKRYFLFVPMVALLLVHFAGIAHAQAGLNRLHARSLSASAAVRCFR